MEEPLTNKMSDIKYAFPYNTPVWLIHIIVAIVFVALGAMHFYYTDKTDTPVDLKVMDNGTYGLIMVLAGLMLLWHGHLLFSGYNIFGKIKNLFGGN
jgi:hypothetical protein